MSRTEALKKKGRLIWLKAGVERAQLIESVREGRDVAEWSLLLSVLRTRRGMK